MRSQKLFIKSYVDKKSLVDQNQRIISGVVGSSGIIDRQGESIDPSGWSLDNYLKNPVLLWAHDYKSLPIGKALRVYIENGELKFDLQFADTDIASDAFNAYKDGFLNAFSVGFIPLKIDETGEFTFAEQELLELSCVPVPANPAALMGRDLEQSQIRIKSIEDKLSSALKVEENEEKPDEEAENTGESQEDQEESEEIDETQNDQEEANEETISDSEETETESQSTEVEQDSYTGETKVSDLTVTQFKTILGDVVTPQSKSEEETKENQEIPEKSVSKDTLQRLQTGLKKTDKSIGLVLRLLKATNSKENSNGEGVSK
jgi:HK97 family phage prohead protease